MKLLYLLFCICFAFRSLAAPYGSVVHHRDVVSSTSGINTTIDIKDHDGMDVTSSFKIKVYQESKARSRNKLNDRFTFSRPMTQCATNSTFMKSYCTPEHNLPTSLQRYSVICLQSTNYFDPHRRIIGSTRLPVLRSGHCRQDEVCVNGLGPNNARAQRQQWAYCVQKSVFDDTMYGDNSQTARDIETVLESPARNAYMVMSKLDGATPVEADTLDIMSWIDNIIDADGDMKESKCRDCMKLKADSFAANTKALKAQATLLSAGAMAGILWMGVFSG